MHNLQKKSQKRLGILGGTFDPIHLGHLTLAQLALEQAGLDALVLMPCHLPPHREEAHASAEDRLALVRLAVAGKPRITVSEYELEKKSTSYTVETLAHFRNEMPDAELYFCLGGDSLAQIKSWYQWQKILELANLVVLERNQDDSELEQDIRNRIVEPIESGRKPAGQILKLTAPQMNVSATGIRKRLIATNCGKEPDSYLQKWLHPNVLKYIKEHQVYA
ncbi:MAG: nicotinate-nucleotide adenylyltransferase [Porticoccaceae bacterium]